MLGIRPRSGTLHELTETEAIERKKMGGPGASSQRGEDRMEEDEEEVAHVVERLLDEPNHPAELIECA